MYLLTDVISYIRRIVKTPSNAVLTDNLIMDYINRFMTSDMDARMQLFDYKTTYRFQTTPGISMYNMPLYNIQTESGNQTISYYPVYQGFTNSCAVNGRPCPFYTEKTTFWNMWPNYIQPMVAVATGDGTTGPYSLTLPYNPAVPGHIDNTGIISIGSNPIEDPPFVTDFLTTVPSTSVFSGVYFTSVDQNGNKVIVADSGQFLEGNTSSQLYGLLMAPGDAPFGDSALSGGYSTTSNTVNYATGDAVVTFPSAIPSGNQINAQCYFYQQGMPRCILFYNNTLTLMPPSNISYLVELEAYLTPAAFLTTNAALPFAYMSEYIARGAARKILADTGDMEQFAFYEPLFREQEMLVWKRSQRQFTSTRTPTIYSNNFNNGNGNSLLGWNGGSY